MSLGPFLVFIEFMKAVVVEKFGGPEVLTIKDIAIPTPGPGEVLVKVHACGVNPVDTYIRSGTHAEKPTLPYTPGKDAAGFVENIGPNVDSVKPGDRVYIAGSKTGTYAEFCVCDTSQVQALPEGITFEQGAGIFVPYATAYRALFQKAKVESGETVLVHGASGAVGVAAVQWAKKLGLRVFGTAGTAEGADLVMRTGADRVFNHSDPNYLSEIFDASEGRGVDVILEMLANVNLVKDFEVLAKRGRIIVIGSRGSIDFPPRLLMGKDASILGMALFNAEQQDMAEIFSAISHGLTQGFLLPVVGKAFPLEEVAEAHRSVIEGKAFGKTVLTV